MKPQTIVQGMLPKEDDTVMINIETISVYSPGNISFSLPLSQPASFRIDSALPQIWLPLEACTMFQTAFGLIWDNDLELYYVNETTHTQLLQHRVSVGFTMVSQPQGLSKVITVSYDTFDLQLQPPRVDTTRSYFPIKRAIDSSQYLLGRAFLQETYLTVDYDQRHFTLSEVATDPMPGGSIVPIFRTAWIPGNETTQSDGNKRLPGGTYAGIGIGAASAFVLVFGSAFLFWVNRWSKLQEVNMVVNTFEKAELHAEDKQDPATMKAGQAELVDTQTTEVMGREPGELDTMARGELETEERNQEADAVRSPIEMEGPVPRGSGEHA
jgi:hypothetical protein